MTNHYFQPFLPFNESGSTLETNYSINAYGIDMNPIDGPMALLSSLLSGRKKWGTKKPSTMGKGTVFFLSGR